MELQQLCWRGVVWGLYWVYVGLCHQVCIGFVLGCVGLGCVGFVLGLCWVVSGLCWVGLCWVVFLWVCVQSARSARYVRDYVTGNTLNLLESHCSDPEAPTGNCVTHLFIESRNQRVNIYLDSDA